MYHCINDRDVPLGNYGREPSGLHFTDWSLFLVGLRNYFHIRWIYYDQDMGLTKSVFKNSWSQMGGKDHKES